MIRVTGIELFKKPSTVAGEIADIVSQPCPPTTPNECDRISCRECWLEWLTTEETTSAAIEGAFVPLKVETPDKQTSLEWTRRFVSVLGISVEGKRYGSQELTEYIGKSVLVKVKPMTIFAQTIDGRDIGELTPYQV